MTEEYMQSYDSLKHFKHLFESCPRQFGFAAESENEWLPWRKQFRQRLLEVLGLPVMDQDLAAHDPTAARSDSVDMGTYYRESWHLLVEPDVPLPFYLLRPKMSRPALPLVLTPHGHGHPHVYVGIYNNDDEKEQIAEGERDIAIQAVGEGYLVIAPTTRAFGETRTDEDREQNLTSSCRTELMHALLVGRTPIGERVWDMSRLIDWAVEHEGVDSRRVAITGNSGGGTISLFAAACDERITVAIPSCYYCTFAGSIGAMGHCDCNYVPGILRLGEMHDVAGLIAPRAFLAVAGRDDPIFPLEHTRHAFDQLKRVYATAGVPQNCELFVGNGGHRYYKERVWPFIRSHFTAAGIEP